MGSPNGQGKYLDICDISCQYFSGKKSNLVFFFKMPVYAEEDNNGRFELVPGGAAAMPLFFAPHEDLFFPSDFLDEYEDEDDEEEFENPH